MISINKDKKTIILLLIGCIVGILLIILSINYSSNNQSEPESNYVPSNAPAVLIDGKQVYIDLDPRQYELLTSDITYFARNYFKDKSERIRYRVDEYYKNDANIKMTLVSENNSSDNIEIEITTRNNSQIDLSIKDLDSGASPVNNDLESNSLKSNLIKILPYTQGSYTIDYNSVSDSFTISLSERNLDLKNEAENYLSSALGLENLSSVEYELLVPGFLDDFNEVNETVIEVYEDL